MSETPTPGSSGSTFTRGFIPGLVVGLLVGLAVGAFVVPLLDQPPPLTDSGARSGAPRTTRTRDEFPVPDTKPPEPAPSETKPDDPTKPKSDAPSATPPVAAPK